MKRLLALLLVSTLAFSFASTAQSLKRFGVKSGILVNISDGLSSDEKTTITTEGTYDITTPSGSTLPSSDPNCTGSIYVCSFWVLIPTGNTQTNQQILDGVKDYITNHSNVFPGCGVEFTFTKGGFTFTGKYFCKNL